MRKIKFLFIALILAISAQIVAPVIYAKEQVTVKDDSEEKEKILSLINDYIDEINTKIEEIDKSIENSKKQEEFSYYPAVRLDMDAPMFGLTSVIESKLRVKKDISTSDVADRYSIRGIVKDKKIRLPESYLGAIVMSTKEYDINKNMSVSNLKLTLVKCIQYLSQVNSVNEYINTQTNNIFRDYISDEKKASMKDVRNRGKRVSTELVNISDEISKLSLLGEDATSYTETYNTLSNELFEINEKAKNTLIPENELNNLVKSSLTNETKIIDFKTTVNNAYESKLEDIDYLLVLQNLQKIYSTKIENMNNYIKGASTTTKKVENNVEQELTTTNYAVTSNATLDYLKQKNEEITTKISAYKKEQKENEKDKTEDAEDTENVENKSEENKEAKTKTAEELKAGKQAKVEENKTKINELYTVYKDILTREHRFYTTNINMLLKDSNDKVSVVIAQIDSGIEIEDTIFDYTKYIYIDLPGRMTDNIEQNNTASSLEMENLIKLLKQEITTLSKNNSKITILYNNIMKVIQNS